jgi:hypothetical protein
MLVAGQGQDEKDVPPIFGKHKAEKLIETIDPELSMVAKKGWKIFFLVPEAVFPIAKATEEPDKMILSLDVVLLKKTPHFLKIIASEIKGATRY